MCNLRDASHISDFILSLYQSIGPLRIGAYERFLERPTLLDKTLHQEVMDTYGRVRHLNDLLNTMNVSGGWHEFKESLPLRELIANAANEVKSKLEELIKKLDEHIKKMDC